MAGKFSNIASSLGFTSVTESKTPFRCWNFTTFPPLQNKLTCLIIQSIKQLNWVNVSGINRSSAELECPTHDTAESFCIFWMKVNIYIYLTSGTASRWCNSMLGYLTWTCCATVISCRECRETQPRLSSQKSGLFNMLWLTKSHLNKTGL